MIKLILVLVVVGYAYYWISDKFFNKNKKTIRKTLKVISDTIQYTKVEDKITIYYKTSTDTDSTEKKKELILIASVNGETTLLDEETAISISFRGLDTPLKECRKGIFLKETRDKLIPILNYADILPNIARPITGIPSLSYWKTNKERTLVVNALRKIFLDISGKVEYPEYRK